MDDNIEGDRTQSGETQSPETQSRVGAAPSGRAQRGAVPRLLAAGFADGTLIRTEAGDRPVETLRAGDMILTLDRGLAPLVWAGRKRVPAVGPNAPVTIAAGTLGNARPLRLSPQHRVLLSGWQTAMLFGTEQVLAPAVSLVNGEAVRQVEGGEIQYHQLLFDRHEIIHAEGACCETMQLGGTAWSVLDVGTRNEVAMALVKFAVSARTGRGDTARPCVGAEDASLLAQYVGDQGPAG